MTAMSAVEQRARPALRCSLSTRALGVLVSKGIYKDATFRICAHVSENTCGTANVSSEELNPGVLNVLNALPLLTPSRTQRDMVLGVAQGSCGCSSAAAITMVMEKLLSD